MKKINPHMVFFYMLLILSSCMVHDFETEWDMLYDNPRYANEKILLDEIKANSLDDINLKIGEKRSVDIKGSFTLTSDEIGPGTYFDLTVEGIGNVSHMGKTELLMQKTVTIDQYANPPVWNASAELIIKSVKGDELLLHYDTCSVNLSNTPNFVFTAECTVSGGTGKFENASGVIMYDETFNWSQSTGILKISGDIEY